MKKNSFKRGILYLLLIFVLVWAIFPIVWFFIVSVKTGFLAFSKPSWEQPLTLQNYVTTFQDAWFIKYFINTIVIGLTATAISLLFGVPAAYALTRFKWKGSESMAFWFLFTYMLPPIAYLIPLFLIFNGLNLINTHFALIISYQPFGIGLVTWMMRGYFKSVSKDIEEAAMLDGLSRFRAFIRIVIPVTAPGLAASAILLFVLLWNAFLWPLILSGPETKTVPLHMLKFISVYEINWGVMAATSTVCIIPVLVFGVLVQKHLVSGLTFGLFEEKKE